MDMPKPSAVGASYCVICRPEVRPHEGPGTPIVMPGVMHRKDCPSFGDMFKPSEELQKELQKQLQDIRRAERQAWVDSHNCFIGG